ncbi:hypothetical protein TVAG_402190 [Trichomonas vaginalis G3]|uniref:Prefoldin subunit family protein n=1 Tax=Trichomonas vaginalis (strain ATCC PRA-98 / G3) TaxID=412133 RepID=A2DHX6_TRIV3|nr:prefoldin family [Trichomonas vaginalis G3]EAY19965.1 hypothetical protein TVAG_402190 [Trichomonas vaginalis G3]KAI5525915.1 prefoldin family [Trichomonas vaginalis G3]|eukprot:XP_001580951.1 hypothetical protein [Trichomonas vaginalis G3]
MTVRREFPEEQKKQYYKLCAEDDRLGDNLAKFSAQLELELRQRRTKYLTRHEISKLNPSVPVYQSCGKAFILDTVPNTLTTLRSDLAQADKHILMIKKTGIHIQAQQAQIKGQINELLRSVLNK